MNSWGISVALMVKVSGFGCQVSAAFVKVEPLGTNTFPKSAKERGGQELRK